MGHLDPKNDPWRDEDNWPPERAFWERSQQTQRENRALDRLVHAIDRLPRDEREAA